MAYAPVGSAEFDSIISALGGVAPKVVKRSDIGIGGTPIVARLVPVDKQLFTVTEGVCAAKAVTYGVL